MADETAFPTTETRFLSEVKNEKGLVEEKSRIPPNRLA
jgi:hypothetical protein